jgi:hypothetical protein
MDYVLLVHQAEKIGVPETHRGERDYSAGLITAHQNSFVAILR